MLFFFFINLILTELFS